jgi:hypothetical protein
MLRVVPNLGDLLGVLRQLQQGVKVYRAGHRRFSLRGLKSQERIWRETIAKIALMRSRL